MYINEQFNRNAYVLLTKFTSMLNHQVAASAGSISYSPLKLEIHGLPYLAFQL